MSSTRPGTRPRHHEPHLRRWEARRGQLPRPRLAVTHERHRPRTAARSRTVASPGAAAPDAAARRPIHGGGSAMSGSLCPRKIAALPSSAVTVSPTWYSRAASRVFAGIRCPLTSASSTTRRAPRCRTVYRTTTPGCSSSGTSESDPSASVRTSTDPPAGTRCQVVAARPVGVSCVSDGDRSYRPHLAVTLITSTVAGTLNASPMAEADIDPERTVASASAPSSSPSSPDAGEATSRSTSSGSSCSSSAGSSGCCRGTSRPSMYRSAGEVPGGKLLFRAVPRPEQVAL